MRVAREIKTAKQFYGRPFSLPLLGCVACDHKETLHAYCNIPYIDYRVIGPRMDSGTVLVRSLLITKRMINPVPAARGHEDSEYVEVFRYSRDDYNDILSKAPLFDYLFDTIRVTV
jgi:hypothetical protein